MLSMGFHLSQRLTFVCKHCGRMRDEEDVQTTSIEAQLFGQVFFARCWACGMETSERSAAYRRWWLKVLVERVESVKDPDLRERIQWEFARRLKCQGGFAPFQGCFWRKATCEFISYPFIENGQLMILVRLKDQPMTMERKPVFEVVPTNNRVAAMLDGLLTSR